MPITAEIVHAETVGLSCEVTVGLEPMTAAVQDESAPSEVAVKVLMERRLVPCKIRYMGS